jgi:hypothetical protein
MAPYEYIIHVTGRLPTAKLHQYQRRPKHNYLHIKYFRESDLCLQVIRGLGPDYRQTRNLDDRNNRRDLYHVLTK